MKSEQIKRIALIGAVLFLLLAGMIAAVENRNSRLEAADPTIGLVQEQIGDLFLDVDGDGDLDYLVEAWIIRNDPAVAPSAPEPAPADPTPAPGQ